MVKHFSIMNDTLGLILGSPLSKKVSNFNENKIEAIWSLNSDTVFCYSHMVHCYKGEKKKGKYL